MNKLDKDYCNLLQDILDNGVTKKDRTGTGTISVFGRQIRHKMSEGFPLLTTKKLHFKSIVVELLWFLRGDTNIKYLVDNDCNIWNGDAYKVYREARPNDKDAYTIEEFAEAIKTNPIFAAKYGNLGPIYGVQWRKWNCLDKGFVNLKEGEEIEIDFNCINISHQVDQIANLINDLKTNPDSRRLMVNAWNVGELDQMVLPPCHYGFQVYTRELSLEERFNLHNQNERIHFEECTMGMLDMYNVPKRAISLMWNQRSVDTFLGLPFNIASYGLLLEIIAKEVNMVPDELIGNLGDTHLYLNHIEQAKEQIGRELTYKERYKIWFNNNYETGMEYNDNDIIDFNNEFYTPTPEKTREPYPLPKLGKIPDYLYIKANWECYKPSDFTLENYQSHPAIKASLSN